MEKIKKIDLKQIYIFILIIITSGSIYGSYIYYKQFIIVLFVSSLIINNRRKIEKKSLIIGVILSSLILLNYFTWMGNIDGYISLIIKIISILLLSNIIDYKKFIKYYVYFFSIYIYISLINYNILLNNWQSVVAKVPIRNVWGTPMRPTLMYTFTENEFYRNFGFFKEGGMYAIFLDIALIFSYKIKQNKWILFSRIMFLFTIATTLSTTGIIAAFIIVIFYSLFSSKIKFKNIVLMLLLFIILLLIETNLGIISNKFNQNNESFTERSSEVSISMNIIEDNIWAGLGYQNSNDLKEYTDIVMTNGVLSLFIQFGFIIGLIILSIYIYGILCRFDNKLDKIIFIILFLFFSASEPVIFQPLFILLIFNNKIYETNRLL